ncbi:MAG: TolC family protein [bacterium]
MKMLLVKAIVIGIGGLLCGSALAAELTLDDCIDLALKNRYSIIAARGNESVAKAGRTAALGAFLPRVSASYDCSMTKRRDGKAEQDIFTRRDTIWVSQTNGDSLAFTFGSEPVKTESSFPDQDLTNKSLSLSASMDLFDLSNFLNYAAVNADKVKAHLDVIASEQDLILSVKVSYYAYLAAFENVDVQRDAVERSKEQLKLIESRFELGSAAKTDVLKQKVQVGNDRLALLSAENAATTTKADLAFTIGLDPNHEIEFQTAHTPRQYDGTLDEAVDFGLTHKPSLLSSEKSADASKHRLRGAKSSYLPTLGGFGRMTWSDGTQGDTVTYNSSSRSLTYGIGVSWNIFDGFFREYQLSQAKVARNNSLAWLSESRNLVALSVKTAYLDIDKTRTQQQLAQENVDAATEDLKITQEKYDLGAATILDLLNAQVSLKTAQVSLIRAGFDHNLAIARLENAMGKM